MDDGLRGTETYGTVWGTRPAPLSVPPFDEGWLEADMDDAGVDFAFVAWREEGRWNVVGIPAGPADSLANLELLARQRQGDSGSLAFVSVADEFFVCLRVQGARTRVLLSDVTAALDWPMAEEAAEMLGLDAAVIEEAELMEPAGDLQLLSDYGVTPADLDLLCGDPELYPDEQIGTLAVRIGFDSEIGSVLESV
jgi:putative tRNA adenosine deaminase-associated protein